MERDISLHRRVGSQEASKQLILLGFFLEFLASGADRQEARKINHINGFFQERSPGFLERS
jgi:hypothetical protein